MPTLAATALSTVDPWAVQSRIGLTDARLGLNTSLMPNSELANIDCRSGVMAAGVPSDGSDTHRGMRVMGKAGATWQVIVLDGSAVINTPSLGAYLCTLDSEKTLDIAPASATTNRIDLIVARVYDDLNAAIASPADTRTFQIEVWQGDEATGTPVEPTPSASEGWIPLAAVQVNKGATEVTNAGITDKRGPGLVARGGLHLLHGADTDPSSPAYIEAGGYIGEQRWVQGREIPHQVYQGSSKGWRGVANGVRYHVDGRSGGPSGKFSGWGTIATLFTVVVAYPGAPYMISGDARAFYSLHKDCAVDLSIMVTGQSGSRRRVNYNRQNSYGADGPYDVAQTCSLPLEGPYTTDAVVEVELAVRYTPGTDFGFFLYAPDDRTMANIVVSPEVETL